MSIKKDVKRQKILQAAIEIFGRSNFRDASICEIARRSGVAEGTIYQYFKNKQDLFFSIPVAQIETFAEELEARLDKVTDAVEQLKRLSSFYLEFFNRNPDYARSLMLEMRVSRDFARSKTYKGLKKFSNRIIEILVEGQKQGVIRADMDVYLLRQLLLGVLEHMVTRWLLKGEKGNLMKYSDQAFRLVLEGIGLKVVDAPGNKEEKDKNS